MLQLSRAKPGNPASSIIRGVLAQPAGGEPPHPPERLPPQFPVLPAPWVQNGSQYTLTPTPRIAPRGPEWPPPQFPGRGGGLGGTSIVVLLCNMRANVTLYLGVRSTSKTTDIGHASMAQWLECSTHEGSGFEPHCRHSRFLVVFNPPSLVRTTVEKKCASAWYPRQTM